MTDLIDFVKLLTALVSLLTALIGLSEALKQRTKQKKRGRRLYGIDPLIEVTAPPSSSLLGLPSTLFYPRTPGLTNGFSVTKSRRPLRCHWGLWDALSARGLNRKRHPGLKVKSGEQLPPEDRFGKGIPFWSQKLGRSFRQACHPESVSRSEPEFWDELSTEASTGKCIPFRGLILGCTFRGETTVFRKSTRP